MKILEHFTNTKIANPSYRFKHGRVHGCDVLACGREKTHPMYDNMLKKTAKHLDENSLDDQLVRKNLEHCDFKISVQNQ